MKEVGEHAFNNPRMYLLYHLLPKTWLDYHYPISHVSPVAPSIEVSGVKISALQERGYCLPMAAMESGLSMRLSVSAMGKRAGFYNASKNLLTHAQGQLFEFSPLCICDLTSGPGR